MPFGKPIKIPIFSANTKNLQPTSLRLFCPKIMRGQSKKFPAILKRSSFSRSSSLPGLCRRGKSYAGGSDVDQTIPFRDEKSSSTFTQLRISSQMRNPPEVRNHPEIDRAVSWDGIYLARSAGGLWVFPGSLLSRQNGHAYRHHGARRHRRSSGQSDGSFFKETYTRKSDHRDRVHGRRRWSQRSEPHLPFGAARRA